MIGPIQRLTAILKGKKTYLGGTALAAIALIWNLDALLHGELTWFDNEQYLSAAAFIGGITQVFLRIGVKNAGGEKPSNGYSYFNHD